MESIWIFILISIFVPPLGHELVNKIVPLTIIFVIQPYLLSRELLQDDQRVFLNVHEIIDELLR